MLLTIVALLISYTQLSNGSAIEKYEIIGIKPINHRAELCVEKIKDERECTLKTFYIKTEDHTYIPDACLKNRNNREIAQFSNFHTYHQEVIKAFALYKNEPFRIIAHDSDGCVNFFYVNRIDRAPLPEILLNMNDTADKNRINLDKNKIDSDKDREHFLTYQKNKYICGIFIICMSVCIVGWLIQ